MPGDERSPSWTPTVASCSRIAIAAAAAAPPMPVCNGTCIVAALFAAPTRGRHRCALTATSDNETYPACRPTGAPWCSSPIATPIDDVDLWAMPVPAASVAKPVPLGTQRPRPPAARPPPSARRADTPARGRPPQRAVPQGVRVTRARAPPSELGPGQSRASRSMPCAKASARSGRALSQRADRGPARIPVAPGRIRRRRRNSSRVVAARPPGRPTGGRCSSRTAPMPQPVYNGNPLRNKAEAPPLFAVNDAFQIWRVPAPLPVHEDGGTGHRRSEADTSHDGRRSIAAGDACDPLFLRRVGPGLDGARREKSGPCARRANSERARGRARRHGRRAAADQAGRHLVGCCRRVRASAGVGSRTPRAEERRQHRRCDGGRVVALESSSPKHRDSAATAAAPPSRRGSSSRR